MKTLGFFDSIFGFAAARPAALPRHTAVTDADSDKHPLQDFFTDALLESQLGGPDALAAFKTETAVETKRLADGYTKITARFSDHTIAPLTSGETKDAAIAKISATARKVRRTHASGNVVVEEFDAAGALVRTFVEEPQ
jgi:hypothetical protein